MRDDFSQKVKEELARRVGYLCSNPQCKQPTVGAQGGDDGSINIGEAAHICAASPGGKRFDSNMSSEQRADISNGIWLCRNCAAMIDRDEAFFTTDILRLWRQLAESEANQAIQLGRPIGSTRRLSNNDCDILQFVVDRLEQNCTIYILKEHDFHGGFQRSNLDHLFELIDFFQKPSSRLQNKELQEFLERLIDKIYTFRGLIAIRGGPANFGQGRYVIDREEDQSACNDLCNDIWHLYENLIHIRNNYEF